MGKHRQIETGLSRTEDVKHFEKGLLMIPLGLKH